MRKTRKIWCMLLVMLVCLAIPQKAYAATVNEKESNNSFETANAINSGDTVNGSITEEDDYDYYKITLQTASMLQIDFTSYMKFYTVVIYDESGEQIWYTDDNGWNSTVGYRRDTHKLYLEAGTYYMKVTGYWYSDYGKSTGRYSFTLTINGTSRNNREPDNVFAQANRIRMGDTLKGQISANDNLDIWNFELSASGRIELNIISYMKYYCMVIYNADGTALWYTDDNLWNEDAGFRRDSYTVDLEAGVYYLEVNGYWYSDYGKSTGIYDISTGFDASGAVNNEPDNSFAQANRITLGTVYRGQIAQNDDFDTYYFSMPASGRIQIDITSWMKYYCVKIFDTSGKELWYTDDNSWNENVGYRTDQIIVELPSGNYYMQINGYLYSVYEKSTGVYQFKVIEKGDSGTSSNETSVTVSNNIPGQTNNSNVPTKNSVHIVGALQYKVTKSAAKDGTLTVTKLMKAGPKVTIPSTVIINGYTFKVTGIDAMAFKGMKKLKKAVIGANVRTVGFKAFYGCKNLKTITVKSKVLKSVGGKALKGIHKKAAIIVPKAKLKVYKALWYGKGQAMTVKIK